MLTPAQKRLFRDQGFLVLPGAAPQALVKVARHAIHHSLGEEGMNKQELPTLRAQTYCREIRDTAAITDPANRSAVFSAVESLVGEGNLQAPGSGQIALRFPLPPGHEPGPPRGHLDGLGSGANGMEKGVYRRGFTGLAVVYLSDVPEPFGGNFTEWPGSHRFLEDHFRAHGHEMLGDGMPQVELPEPPVSRLRHCDVEGVGHDAYTDIWREWPGVAALEETGA